MLLTHGRRWTTGVVAGLLVALCAPPSAVARPAPTAVIPVPPPVAQERLVGPALVTPAAARARALRCSGDLEAAERPPVLLVPGTSLTPMENWGPTYLPLLLDRGHAVCLVSLPAYATRDVQANVEYVASAIHTMARRSSRPISTIGHSQGALLPQAALRTWPGLAPYVADVIGIAGVYDAGSAAVRRRCAEPCVPVLHQLATGSAFLAQLARRPLPSGPAYTNLGVLGDRTVTPQPAANQQESATSLMLQEVCPGRPVPQPQHAMIAGDAVALALTLDALDHPGPAAPHRLDPGTCELGYYPEFDAENFLAPTGDHYSRLADPVVREPVLWCRHRADCRTPRLRGRLLTDPRLTVRPHRVALRFAAVDTGRVRVLLGDRAVVLAARPGPMRLTLRREGRAARLRIQTRPRYYSAWATEARRWLPR